MMSAETPENDTESSVDPLNILFLTLQDAYQKDPDGFIRRDDELEVIGMEQRLLDIQGAK